MLNFDRTEICPGIFSQYTYTCPEKFNGIAGLRVDHNSLYGLLITPRMHLRYNHWIEHTALRASAGRGYRAANVLAENTGVLASSRVLHFAEDFRYGKSLELWIEYHQELASC